MRYPFVFIALLFWITLFSQNTFACECSWNDQNMSKEKVKDVYLKEPQGAIFKGKVIELKEESIDWNGEESTVRKITIEVEKYWFGVNKRQVIIYTKKFGCGISNFEKGKVYFFVSHVENGKLVTTVCDYMFQEYFTESEFSVILGKAKTFKKTR